MRITGPGSGDTLFRVGQRRGAGQRGRGRSWSSRSAPTAATVPPLPTEAVIVATETPTPANVLTQPRGAWTATAEVAQFGTPTPPQYRYVTPTATPANLATVQARCWQASRPSSCTPTPANGDRVGLEWLAAAKALAHRHADRPAAGVRDAGHHHPDACTCERDDRSRADDQGRPRVAEGCRPGPGTPSSPPVTPTPYVIRPPGNQATAQALSACTPPPLTMLTGTFTPYPADAVTATARGAAQAAAARDRAPRCTRARARTCALPRGRVSGCGADHVAHDRATCPARSSCSVAVHESFAAYVVPVRARRAAAEGCCTGQWRSTTAIEGRRAGRLRADRAARRPLHPVAGAWKPPRAIRPPPAASSWR